MTPDIYWVKGIEPHRFAIMPRPRTGDWLADEIEGYRRAGISVIVSLLELHEAQELGLNEEPQLCKANGIQFITYPIPDRGVPDSFSKTHEIVTAVIDRLRFGSGVAIHCRVGIGRTGLIAGCILAELGVKPPEIFPLLSTARRVPVPDTPLQEAWLLKYVDSILTIVQPVENVGHSETRGPDDCPIR